MTKIESKKVSKKLYQKPLIKSSVVRPVYFYSSRNSKAIDPEYNLLAAEAS